MNKLLEDDYIDVFENLSSLASEGLIRKTVIEETPEKVVSTSESVADVLDALHMNQPKTFQTRTVVTTENDDYVYEDIIESTPRLRQMERRVERELATYPDLQSDLFQSLFKYNPVMTHENDMMHSHRVNHKLMDEVDAIPEFRRLRQSCMGDDFSAAIGAVTLGQEVRDIILRWKDEGGEMADAIQAANDSFAAQNKAQMAQMNAQSLQEMLNAMQAGGDAPVGMSEAQLQQAAEQAAINAAQAQQLADELAQQAETKLNDVPRKAFEDLQRQARQAIKETEQEIQEANDIVNTWGLDPGSGIRVPIENKQNAINAIRHNARLKNMMDLIGSLKLVANQETKRKSRKGNSVKSIEVGNDLESVLMSEKMRLKHDTLKYDFYQRYSQKQLLQYEKESRQTKGRGPIICCIDTSGSMQGHGEYWSKALAIAMLEVAQKQKRDFCAILYCSRVDRVFYFERDQFNPMDVVEMAERFSGGGTNFERPLEKAMLVAGQSRYKKADIVFITDGDCSLSSGFAKRFTRFKEDNELTCRGVVVDNYRVPDTLKSFCDDIVHIADVRDAIKADSKENRAIFQGLSKDDE